ncbi:hypothetical protein GCM10009589_37270 [Arthrobacter pascens]
MSPDSVIAETRGSRAVAGRDPAGSADSPPAAGAADSSEGWSPLVIVTEGPLRTAVNLRSRLTLSAYTVLGLQQADSPLEPANIPTTNTTRPGAAKALCLQRTDRLWADSRSRAGVA